MGDGAFTVRRDRAFWLVRAGEVVVYRARSKPEAVAWALRRSTSVYVQNLAGKLVRYVAGRDDPRYLPPELTRNDEAPAGT